MAFGAQNADDIMDTMRKPWVYKRKGIKGWWTGWYEGGKRKAKALPSKSLAEHFFATSSTHNSTQMFSPALLTSIGRR